VFDFTSRDAFGLGASDRLNRAAAGAVGAAGVHAAAHLSRALEAAVGDWLGQRYVVLFESGLDARVRTIAALAHGSDYVVIDRCAHPALGLGARHATPHVVLHEHRDFDELRAQLCELRGGSATRGILVVAESFYPLESASPDLSRLRELCIEYEARLLVDATHDLAVLGPDGTGQLGVQGVRSAPDVVVGALSGPLVAGLGFAATGSRSAAEFLKFRSGLHVDLGGPSAFQCAVALEALRVVRSSRGERLRAEIAQAAAVLHGSLSSSDVPCLGSPTPFVIVPLGWEGVSRLVSSLLIPKGVYANSIEYPVVPPGASRLCLRIPAGMLEDATVRAAGIIADAVRDARELVARA
jgi:7-keto-8-aminopelargonate synthetase-like enzyme